MGQVQVGAGKFSGEGWMPLPLPGSRGACVPWLAAPPSIFKPVGASLCRWDSPAPHLPARTLESTRNLLTVNTFPVRTWAVYHFIPLCPESPWPGRVTHSQILGTGHGHLGAFMSAPCRASSRAAGPFALSRGRRPVQHLEPSVPTGGSCVAGNRLGAKPPRQAGRAFSEVCDGLT